MSDAPASLAHASARIAALEDELARAHNEVDLVAAGASAMQGQLSALQGEVETLRPLQARVTEFEALLAPPPDGSGITLVRRYRTSHGTEHEFLPDALHAMRCHALVSRAGMTAQQAESAILNSEAIVKALSSPLTGP